MITWTERDSARAAELLGRSNHWRFGIFPQKGGGGFIVRAWDSRGDAVETLGYTRDVDAAKALCEKVAEEGPSMPQAAPTSL